jgi:uncharacterized protein (TIGR00255 family)
MIRSMTGFGAAERSVRTGRLQVELRTVNHRYLNVNVRIPTLLARLEVELREWLRAWFNRGHVNCTVRFEPDEAAAGALALQIDEQKVRAYLAAFRDLGERFGVPGTPDLALLTRFSDLFVRGGPDGDALPVEPAELRATLEEASRQLITMREDEGRRLAVDLQGRLDAISQALEVIAERAPQRLLSERDRLRDAVRDLTDGIAVDEARLAQEIAFLAERLDVHEELVRFRSHIELFGELLRAPAQEAVGKRLAFLVQEMHREANTIGSKANDSIISHRVIAIKEEVERLREQVENVE